MAERIEKLKYQDNFTELFYDGPGEFLVKELAKNLKTVTQWSQIFGEYIDGYQRMDYPVRGTPALRIYNEQAIKQFDSWFIEGDIKADIIFPGSLRREELQQFQDTVSAALLQQFRRPNFFNLMQSVVPGLNELGKTFRIDKSLGFEWGENIVPLTQITVNFRIDLREWDVYLEETLRTKDSPYEQVLGQLKRIVQTTEALDDNGTKQAEAKSDFKPGPTGC
jgi:hypothetical protein